MKKIGIYAGIMLIIIVFIPTIIVKIFNFVPGEVEQGENTDPKKEAKIEELDLKDAVKVYDTRTQEVVALPFEEYIKGVISAEMPAEFHIEALKAQAIASRTYAVNRILKYSATEGNPGHPEAPLCTGVHCQAYLTLEELKGLHASDWEEKYWGKIEEAVDSTKGQVLHYNGEVIDALYHSTSSGMTEDAIDVFNTEIPYLQSVESRYEEDAPRYKNILTITVDEFIDKINSKFQGANVTKENLGAKIKLVEKTDSGRVKKIAIDGTVVNGRELRELFELDSTNFKIYYSPKSEMVDIETIGYGHGVGMSQWGANGMAKNGEGYEQILKHYYTGIEIEYIDDIFDGQ